MKMRKEQLYDKIYAGWMGKNIGGTLGGPLEGVMKLMDIRDYTQEFLGPVENDDLDLQLVALHCAEQYGGVVTTQLLAQEWASHVFFQFDEYGHALTNLRKGLTPPLAGIHDNFFTDCMGAPIRSELWGMVCAGLPDLAAYYAYQDASVDHAGGEGMYGEIFFAVFESLAFESDDIAALIEKSLSYLPKDCMVYQAVSHLLLCKEQGKTWQEARQSLIDHYAGENFTYAPVNIAFTLMGLLYEKGFTDCLLTTTNCGYDTDCTCATIASMMGILYGRAYIDEQWTEPLGEAIRMSEPVKGFAAPATISELTERTLRVRELILAHYNSVTDKAVYDIPYETYQEMRCIPQGSVNACDLDVVITYADQVPTIAPLHSKQIFLKVTNHLTVPYELEIALQLPEGFCASEEKACTLAPQQSDILKFTITAPAQKQATYPLLIIVKRYLNGMLWKTDTLPFTLLPTIDWNVTADGVTNAAYFSDHAIVTAAPVKELCAETELVVPTDRMIKWIVTCKEPVTLRVDGEMVICCDEDTPVIPAYHRSDERKCYTMQVAAGTHQVVLTAKNPKKLYCYAVSTLYAAEYTDTVTQLKR